MTAPPAFELQDATVQFPAVRALDGVSLRIARGEVVALVGPSGAGKTTLLRLLNGTARLQSGRVTALGSDLAKVTDTQLRRVRARIGFVPQDFGLVPELRVLQNVAAGRVGQRSLWGVLRDVLRPSAATVADVYAILDRVGIPDKLYERTSRLSGGQQQRVAVARSLYQSPDALLADEPVSSVDQARAQATMRLLVALAEERGLTLVVSLHHVQIAREFFPRLIGMRGGRVVFDQATTELRDADFEALYDLADDEILQDGPA